MAIKPKYRELTSEELKELEKEFVDYLIVNGITADDWVKLKEDDKEKANDIITLFSDVVFEGVMRKVQFLEFVSASEIRTFQCLEQKMVLVGMTTDNPNHDFTDKDFIAQASSQPPQGIKVYTSEKAYNQSREAELFDMIQNGCYISDGKLFKVLSMSL